MLLPDPSDAPDPAVRQRTAKLLGNHAPTLVAVLEQKDVLALVEVRAIVARLRTLMMDATFDDTHTDADVAETSELYEWWRQHLAQVT